MQRPWGRNVCRFGLFWDQEGVQCDWMKVRRERMFKEQVREVTEG